MAVAPLHPRLLDIRRGVAASERLEKLAADYADDREVLTKIAQAKLRVEAATFEMIKHASPFVTGLKWGAGAGIPLAALLGGAGTMAGRHFVEHGRRQSEELARTIRNEALTGALGLAGIGAGAYGLSKLVSGKEGNPIDALVRQKIGSADEGRMLKEAIHKLATVGAIDSMLDKKLASDDLDEETQKLGAEIQAMNRSYGMHILRELYR